MLWPNLGDHQESVEDLRSKVEDVARYEAGTHEAGRDTEYRLQRLQEITERTADELAVIHRFMTGSGSTAQEEETDEEGSGSHGQSDGTGLAANFFIFLK